MPSCAVVGRRRRSRGAIRYASQEGRIETSQAAEAGSQCDLGDRQRGFGQQLLGEQQAPRAVHADRCRAKAIDEQATQLALADVHAFRQRRQRLFGQHALVDQLQCARHDFIAATPCAVAGRQFGSAAQARSEAGGFRRRGIAVVGDVRGLRRRRRAHRAAIDAGAFDGGEEQAVEARIAAQSRLFADLQVGQGRGGRAQPCAQASTGESG